MSLTVKILGDASHLQKTLAGAKTSLGNFAKGVGTLAVKTSAFAAASVAAGTAIAAWKLADSVKDVLALGGELTDLSTRTGESAGELLVLKEALRRAGMESADVATILQRLGKNLEAAKEGTGAQAEALDALGIEATAFNGMSLAQKFELVGNRIGAMSDEGKRAQALMALFGREGLRLQAVFGDPTAFEVARSAVGGLAGIMDRSAGKLDAFDDAWGSLGLKLLQIGGVIAENMLPHLERLQSAIDKIDLASAIGRADFAKMVSDAAEKAGNDLVAVGQFIGSKIAEGLSQTVIPSIGDWLKKSQLANVLTGGTGFLFGSSIQKLAPSKTQDMGTLGVTDFLDPTKPSIIRDMIQASQIAEAENAVRSGMSTLGRDPEVVRIMQQIEKNTRQQQKPLLQN